MPLMTPRDLELTINRLWDLKNDVAKDEFERAALAVAIEAIAVMAKRTKQS